MGREIVEQNDGALPTRKEVFEGKDLATIAQRALREQPHLGKRVEHNSARVHLQHSIQNVLCRLAEFHLGGMKQRQLLVGVEARFRWHQLENVVGAPPSGPVVALRSSTPRPSAP